MREYKDLTVDMASILRAKTDIDWQTYHELKAKRTDVGKLIIENFKDHRLYVNQANLTKESIAVACGLKARPLALEEKIASDTVDRYAFISDQTRKVFKLMNHRNASHDGLSEAKEYYNELKNERFILAGTIMKNPAIFKQSVYNSYKQTGLNMTGIAKVYERGIKDDSLTSESSYKAQNHMKLSDSNYVKFNKTSPDEIKNQLTLKTSELAMQLLGDPISRTSRELRFGKKGSISVHTHGPKQGLYCNFETGVKGGPLVLISEQLNLDYKESFKWAASWLNLDENHINMGSTFKKDTGIQINNTKIWTPIFPAPNNTPDIKTDKYLSYQLRGHHETARFTYKDEDGNPLGHVVRLEDDHGNKKTLPLTYCMSENGVKAWRWQGFGGENNSRPLYGLEQLSKRPGAPILIVEGEKTCEAARKIFPDHNVITWSGGCGAVAKTDWNPLNDYQNKDITIWPDHDKPGIKAANQVGAELLKLDNLTRSNIKIVDLGLDIFSEKLPHKWDLADELPDRFNDKIYKLCMEKAPQIGQQLSNNQFSEDKLQARINQLGLEKRLGPVLGEMSDCVEVIYEKLSSLYPNERDDVISTIRLDQALYMGVKLKQANFEMNDPKSRLNFIKRTTMESQVLAVMPDYDQKDVKMVADDKLDDFKNEKLSSGDTLLKCVNFKQNFKADPKEFMDSLSEVCSKIHKLGVLEQKLHLCDQKPIEMSKTLKLNERMGDFKLDNKAYNYVLKTLTKFDNKEDGPTTMSSVDRKIQALYITAQMQNHIDILANKNIRDEFLNKISLEGQLLATNHSTSQNELEKCALAQINESKANFASFEKENQSRVIAIECLHGTKDIGPHLDKINDTKKEIHKVSDYLVAKENQKQLELKQIEYAKDDDNHKGPSMEM